MFRFVVVLTIFLAVDGQNLKSRRREYFLRFSYAENSNSTILINGQMPGPTIRADLNEILVIHVENNLTSTEELTVHFHGMHFTETVQMDGVAFVTQMPIERGKSFSYVFRAYPSGTYFYHSHSGLQAITAFGALIIDNPRTFWKALEPPSGPLLFSDQWIGAHRPTLEANLLASPFRWIGEPTYLLINGRRDFQMILQPNRRYLLRLVGATSLSTIVFSIDQHPMTVVELDGTLVKPKLNVNSIEIASGQRYAVMIQTKQQRNGTFLMRAEIRWRALPINSSVVGVVTYGINSIVPSNLSTLPKPILANESELINFAWNNPYESLDKIDQMPSRKANREYFLHNTQEYGADGRAINWLTNNASLTMSRLMSIERPIVFDIYDGNYDNSLKDISYTMEEDEIVDFVFQNTAALNGICESHPFHMHGHKFWVHSYGPGFYNQSSSNSIKMNNPVYRDTFLLYATQYEHFAPNRSLSNHRKPCGWTKIRVLADNPGLWLFHCHIGAHALMGMNFLVTESVDQISMRYFSKK